jgi:hypothetical protein
VREECRWSREEDDRRKKMKQGRRKSNGADGVVATSWLVVQGSVIRLALPNGSLLTLRDEPPAQLCPSGPAWYGNE